MERGEEARDCGLRPGRLGEGVLEDGRLFGEPIEVGGDGAFEAVKAEVVAAKSVDQNENDGRPLRRRRKRPAFDPRLSKGDFDVVDPARGQLRVCGPAAKVSATSRPRKAARFTLRGSGVPPPRARTISSCTVSTRPPSERRTEKWTIPRLNFFPARTPTRRRGTARSGARSRSCARRGGSPRARRAFLPGCCYRRCKKRQRQGEGDEDAAHRRTS